MTTFNFPFGLDDFQPALINDIVVVNADHVNDLRQSILEVEKALLGPTPLEYDGTTIVLDQDAIKVAIEKLDLHIATVESMLGIIVDAYGDGYSGRIDTIEGEMFAHRTSPGPIDAYGYGVHDVEGQVVGTENVQYLTNKTYDSGLENIGPKFTARAKSGDETLAQYALYGVDTGSSAPLNFYIDDGGNSYFAGDMTVEGDQVFKGVERVENHLIVDGYSILGNNSSLDYTIINGTLTANSSVAIAGDITHTGTNTSLGDGYGTSAYNFTQSDFSGSVQIGSGLVVNGSVVLDDDVTMNGSITARGHIHTLSGLRVLGNQVIIEDTGSDLRINIDVDEVEITATNSIVLNSPTQITNDLVVSNINASGSINAALGFLYTPATPAYWSTSPTTVKEALDRLAAHVYAQHGIIF